MALKEKEIQEIRSLVSLLDDDDPQVYVSVRKRLLEYGEIALPYLPGDLQFENTAKKRIAEIRDIITRSAFKSEFKALKRTESNDIDLEDGIFLIARQRYPDVVMTPYIEQLNHYAYELKEKISSITDNPEILRRTISFLIEEKQFSGNQDDYYNENNHYINRVLETKQGIPITLSAVFLLVGQRINLPIAGIGLPGHFTLRFSYGTSNIFFDPFNGGKILSESDCKAMVQNLGFSFTPEYLEPVTNKQIVERMLRNIILSLERKNEKGKIETIRTLIDTLNSDL